MSPPEVFSVQNSSVNRDPVKQARIGELRNESFNFRLARDSGAIAKVAGQFGVFVGDRRSTTESGLVPDIPRCAHGEDAFIAAG